MHDVAGFWRVSPFRRTLLLAAGALGGLVIVVLFTALSPRPAEAQVVSLPQSVSNLVNSQLIGAGLPSAPSGGTAGPQIPPAGAAVVTMLSSQVTSAVSSTVAMVSDPSRGLPTPTLPLDPGRLLPTMPLPIFPLPSLPAPLPILPTSAPTLPVAPTLLATVDVSDVGLGQAVSTAGRAAGGVTTSSGQGSPHRSSAVDATGLLGPARGRTSLQPLTFPGQPVGGLVGARAGGASPHGGVPLTFAASTDATLAAILIACLALARMAGRGLLLDERAARPA